MKKRILPLLLLLILWPVSVFAHQPQLVGPSPVNVTDPEISKAYYGELKGQPDIFTISSETPFNLYVNILEPDLADQPQNTSAVIIKDGNEANPVAMLNGMNFEWTRFWEPFGADSYWKGPEFRTRTEAGKYEIRVLNTMNRGKYVLAIGETEAFGLKETIDALKIVPQLKSGFFRESPITFIRSPFGWGMILALYLLVVIVGLLAHFAVGKLGKRANVKLPAEHRLLLAGLGIVFLFWAMATTWNPVVIFLSGVCLFEASGISAILNRAK